MRFEAENDTISGAMIVDMLEDDEGYIWLASLGDGLIRFDPKSRTFEVFRSDAGKALNVAGNALNCLYMDEANNLWMGTYSTGLLKFDTDQKQFYSFNLSDGPIIPSDAFKLNSIHAIEPEYGNPNILWLASNNGLHRFDQQTSNIEHYPSTAPNTLGMSCHALYAAKKGIMWVGTYSGGLVKFHTDTKLWEYFPADLSAWESNSTSNNIVLDIQAKSVDELWVSTQDQGLLIFNKNSLLYSAIPIRENDPFALPEKGIREMYIDSDNRIWVMSMNKGISLANPKQSLFNYTLVRTDICTPDQGNYINNFAWDPNRKLLFIVSEGCEGLLCIRRKKSPGSEYVRHRFRKGGIRILCNTY